MTYCSSLAQEVVGQVREVLDAPHPHGGARLGVGAEDEVVLLLPEEVPLQGLPRGAQGSQVVAATRVLDPRAQLTLGRKENSVSFYIFVNFQIGL